jgi:hypothetical protein
VFGPASTGERWLAETPLRWRRYPQAPVPRAEELAAALRPSHKKGNKRVGPTGRSRILPWLGVVEVADMPYLADLGLQGEIWTRQRYDYCWPRRRSSVTRHGTHKPLLLRLHRILGEGVIPVAPVELGSPQPWRAFSFSR